MAANSDGKHHPERGKRKEASPDLRSTSSAGQHGFVRPAAAHSGLNTHVDALNSAYVGDHERDQKHQRSRLASPALSMSAAMHSFTDHCEVMKVEGSAFAPLREGTAQAGLTLAGLAAQGEQPSRQWRAQQTQQMAQAGTVDNVMIKTEDAEEDSVFNKTEEPEAETVGNLVAPEVYEKWVADGKKPCPECTRPHPGPCDPAKSKKIKDLLFLKEAFPEQYDAVMAKEKAEKKAAKALRRKNKVSARTARAPVQAGPSYAANTGRGSATAPSQRSSRSSAAARGVRWCQHCRCAHPEGRHTKPVSGFAGFPSPSGGGRALTGMEVLMSRPLETELAQQRFLQDWDAFNRHGQGLSLNWDQETQATPETFATNAANANAARRGNTNVTPAQRPNTLQGYGNWDENSSASNGAPAHNMGWSTGGTWGGTEGGW
jgi:hypothetical protein